MSDQKLTWCAAFELSSIELASAASWIRSMDADYYEIFSNDAIKLDGIISALLMASESEFGPTLFVRNAGKLAGFITYFPAAQIFARRIFVLKSLLTMSTDLISAKRKLQMFNGAKIAVADESLYLSKIFVCSSARRAGLSTVLLNRFVGGGVSGQRLTLHVSRENIAALALYKKQGFIKSVESAENAYFLMEKNLYKGSIS